MMEDNAFAMFAQDNAEFIKDVEQAVKDIGLTGPFDPAIPHIDMGGKVYFSMTKE